MPKDVPMSIKREPEGRAPLMARAARRPRPAAQLSRACMRFYLERQAIPNELTAETILKARRGNGVFPAKDAEDLFQPVVDKLSVWREVGIFCKVFGNGAGSLSERW